jgi:hypothetical protein
VTPCHERLGGLDLVILRRLMAHDRDAGPVSAARERTPARPPLRPQNLGPSVPSRSRPCRQPLRLILPLSAINANDMLTTPMPARAASPSNKVRTCHPEMMRDRSAPRRYVTGL